MPTRQRVSNELLEKEIATLQRQMGELNEKEAEKFGVSLALDGMTSVSKTPVTNIMLLAGSKAEMVSTLYIIYLIKNADRLY